VPVKKLGKRFDVLMAEVRAEFAKGRIIEAPLISNRKNEVLHGFCSRKQDLVFIDPSGHVVETLMHELLHRRFPEWTERKVRRTAADLRDAMSDAERMALYRDYKKAATKWRKPIKFEEEE